MKQQLILALTVLITLITLAVVACNQNDVTAADATVSTLANARISGVTSSSAASCNATRGSSETLITAGELPATALTYPTTNYAGYTLVQAEQGTTTAGTVYYEVKFTLNGVTKHIHFDANGALI